MNARGRIQPPSRLTMALEGRGLFDVAGFLPSMPVLMTAPRGEPQSVLVLPGLGADDRSTMPLRSYLSALGYDVHGWGLDRNHRAPDLDLGAIHDHIARLRDKSGRKVSLVGWSRGGILAREAARRAIESSGREWPTVAACEVEFVFHRRRPKGHFGSGRNAGVVKASAPAHPTSRPDVLKLARAAEDALTGIVWHDDAAIVDERLRKVWGDREGCTVTVRLLSVEADASTLPV